MTYFYIKRHHKMSSISTLRTIKCMNSCRIIALPFLLLQIGDFYAMESNSYGLAEEYWCVARPPSPKQVCACQIYSHTIIVDVAVFFNSNNFPRVYIVIWSCRLLLVIVDRAAFLYCSSISSVFLLADTVVKSWKPAGEHECLFSTS